MCHDHLTRHRAWEDDPTEREEIAEDDADSEPIPPLQADDDPDEELELLTDGGDE